jgi:cupin fold WbuC family metalloprotein
MTCLHRNDKNFITIDSDIITKMADEAKASSAQMSRYLLHTSVDQSVQEMLIAFTNQCQMKPNQSPGRSESLKVIQGEMLLIEWNEQGEVVNQLEMGDCASGKPFLYRYNATPWHLMLALTEVVIVHEAIEGPFVKMASPAEPLWTKKVSLVPGDYMSMEGV